jgi:hypothetical protein
LTRLPAGGEADLVERSDAVTTERKPVGCFSVLVLLALIGGVIYFFTNVIYWDLSEDAHCSDWEREVDEDRRDVVVGYLEDAGLPASDELVTKYVGRTTSLCELSLRSADGEDDPTVGETLDVVRDQFGAS